MAKKAASPKSLKAKEPKENPEIDSESNDKMANRSKRTKSSPNKNPKKSEGIPAESPTKQSKKRKAAESADKEKETNDDDALTKQEADGDATTTGKPNDNKNGEDGDDAAKSAPAPEKPEIDLTMPIKKARTAYFIFSDEHRDEIKAKHKGEGVAVLARELGQMWSKMTDEEKRVYQEKAALEREQVAQQLAQLQAAGIDLKDLPGAAHATDPNNPNALIIPMARVRKIVKLDPEVKNMSKEACLLVTKCTELFIGKLGIETVRTAQIQNRRKLLPDDIANVTQTREQFLFLRDDVKDFVREQVVQKQKEKGAGAGPNSKEAKAASNSKPLTAYFAAKSS